MSVLTSVFHVKVISGYGNLFRSWFLKVEFGCMVEKRFHVITAFANNVPMPSK